MPNVARSLPRPAPQHKLLTAPIASLVHSEEQTEEIVAANVWALRGAVRKLRKEIAGDPVNRGRIVEEAAEFLRRVETTNPRTASPETIGALLDEIAAVMSQLYADYDAQFDAEKEQRRAEQRAAHNRRLAARKTEGSILRQQTEELFSEHTTREQLAFIAAQRRLAEQRRERDADARARLAAAAALRRAEREQAQAEKLQRFRDRLLRPA